MWARPFIGRPLGHGLAADLAVSPATRSSRPRIHGSVHSTPACSHPICKAAPRPAANPAYGKRLGSGIDDGQYTDAETGYQYLQSRYYDPGTAQFLSADPATAVTGQPYSFASTDPVNLADPSGLDAAAVCITVSAGGHLIVGGSASYEVCEWVGNGWGAETVSLAGGRRPRPLTGR